MKINQKGFGPVEALLIVVIIGLIGFVGWYVWHSKNQTDKSLNEASNTSQNSTTTKTPKSETKQTTNETANWLVYESADKSFKVRLADGWNLVTYNRGAYTDVNKDLKYQVGVKAKITPSEKITELIGVVFVMGLESNLVEPQASDPPITDTFTTTSGLTVKKQYYVDENKEVANYPKGTKSYNYYINYKNRTFTVSYNVKPGETDYHEIVEKVVKTLEFHY